MQYPLSDEESSDSESGIRFKTTNTRDKFNKSMDKMRKYDSNRSRPSKSRHRDKYRSITPEKSHSDRKKSDKYSKRGKEKYERRRKRSETPETSTNYGRDYYKNKRTSNKKSDTDSDLEQLPLKTKKNKESTENNSEVGYFGPKIPEKANTEQFGPKLPEKSESKDSTEDEDQIIGPILPDHIKNKLNTSKTVEHQIIGPVLPEHLRNETNKEKQETDSDDDVIGPLPTNASKSNMQLEERALELKLGYLSKPEDVKVREEWMLELPEIHSANLGLGPRKFRTKMADMSDRSSWTETPKDKANKNVKTVDLKAEAELEQIRQRDLQQERIARKEKKKKKRDKALIELHQEQKEKQKKEETNVNERRPFSREVDLKINRFDEAQTKAIVKKAQLLDSRFSSGQSKFL